MYCTRLEEKDLDFQSSNSLCYPQRSMHVDIYMYLVYFMDLVIRFRTGFVNVQAKIVVGPRKAAVSYLSSWFLVDFLTALPVDIMYPDGDLKASLRQGKYLGEVSYFEKVKR